jgi:flagellar motor switch protein FliN
MNDNKQAPNEAEKKAPTSTRQWDVGLIGHVEVEMSAFIGTLSISIEKLFALQKGDLVKLNEHVDEPLVLMLNGQAFARGELVAVDDSFGVKITELK